MTESKRVPEQIIEILNEHGPSLPIHLAKKIGISSLFISAYLSELAGEKRIKVSHLRLGGSPLYFLEGQEEQLEKFYTFLHPKEVEAFGLLKRNIVLKDSDQEPAIRVALRSIRDFSFGFKANDEIFWRFHSAPESEVDNILTSKRMLGPRKIKPQEDIESREPQKIRETPKRIEPPKPIEIEQPNEQNDEEVEEIREKPELKEPEKVLTKEAKKKQTEEVFLKEVKDYLEQKSIELVSLEYYDKKEIVAKIRFNLAPEKAHLLFAYNKKKIDDKELLKANKKALEHNLDYLVLFKGEFSKKLKDTIEAHKSLVSASKL